MTSRHRTYKGREFNMTAFAEKNAETRSVGNVPMNGRGDIVDSKGNVKVSAKQMANAMSAVNNNKSTQVSLKQDAESAPIKNTSISPDSVSRPAAPPASKPTPQPASQSVPQPASTEPQEISRRIVETGEGDIVEIEYSDGSIEIVKIEKD